MSYEVILHPRAKRELDRVPRELFQRLDGAIWSLREQPRPIGVKKLGDDLYRVRIGNWRVIYAIFDRDRRVVVLRVAKRSEQTYKGLP